MPPRSAEHDAVAAQDTDSDADGVEGTDGASKHGEDGEAVDAEPVNPKKRRKKFTRVKAACDRCKLRKQKCDLLRPRCSNCLRGDAVCLLDGRPAADEPLPKPDEPPSYDKLANRVADLEKMLRSNQGANTVSSSQGVNHSPVQANGGQSATIILGIAPNPAPADRTSLSSDLSFGDLSHHHLRFAHPQVRDMGGRDGMPSTMSFLRPDPPNCRPLLPGRMRKAPLPPQNELQRLVNTFFANRWPNYPIFMESNFRRSVVEPAEPALRSSADMFLLYMVLAIASIDQQSNSRTEEDETGLHFYHTATAFFLEDTLAVDGLVSVQGLLLLAMFANSDPRGVSLWHVTGLIMRMCLDFGLHRLPERSQDLDPITLELHRRVFWSAFAMERLVAVNLGRPVALPVEEITTSLPVFIDDPSGLNLPHPLPDIAAFIHTMTLRGHNGVILATVYRPAAHSTLTKCLTQPVMSVAEMDAWRAAMRLKLDDWLNTAPQFPAPFTSTYKSKDWFQIAHFHSLLLLYRPTALYPNPSASTLQICADASMGLIAAYLRLYTYSKVTYTWAALHSLFMATITAHFALQQAQAIRAATSYDIVQINMRGCSTVLGAMAKRWPAAKQCQSVAESLTIRTLSIFEEDARQTRSTAELAMVLDPSTQWLPGSHPTPASILPVAPARSSPAAVPIEDNHFADIRSDLWAWLGNTDSSGAANMSGQQALEPPSQGLDDPGFNDLLEQLMGQNNPVPPVTDVASDAWNLTAADLDFLLWTQAPDWQEPRAV